MKRLAFLSAALASALALAPTMGIAQSQPTYELDAVIDSRFSSADGLEVLAVTPGGAAQAMGLQAGDRLLRLNGTPFPPEGNASTQLQRLLLESGGNVTFDVRRGAEQLSISGTLRRPVTNADGGCGFVSDTDPTPKATASTFALEITQIDGNSTPLLTKNRFQLPAGQHVLTVREQIPAYIFSRSQLRQRRLLMEREFARAYKAIIVTIEPNTRYSLGAKLIRSDLDTGIRNNTYWEPVVYKERTENCR